MAMATASGFPVLLKNSVSGVSGSLVVAERTGLDTVGDLIALLNSKLAAAAQDEADYFEAVRSIHLYGVKLCETRRLTPLLLDQASSCPRLVANTMRRSKHSGTGRFYARTLTGKKVTLVYDGLFLVKDIKNQIQEREGLPPDQQRLLFDRRQLEDELSLSDYGIQPESTLHVILNLRGGYMAPKIFVDVSNGSLLAQHEFSDTAPKWRVCRRGLNIEGRCASPKCKAFQKMVVSPQGMNAFNLMEDDHAVCPICCKKIEPVTCGFFDCEWKFEGVRDCDDRFIDSPWREALGEKYHRFDADETSGSVLWKSLLLVVKAEKYAVSEMMARRDQEDGVTPSARDLCAIGLAEGGLARTSDVLGEGIEVSMGSESMGPAATQIDSLLAALDNGKGVVMPTAISGSDADHDKSTQQLGALVVTTDDDDNDEMQLRDSGGGVFAGVSLESPMDFSQAERTADAFGSQADQGLSPEPLTDDAGPFEADNLAPLLDFVDTQTTLDFPLFSELDNHESLTLNLPTPTPSYGLVHQPTAQDPDWSMPRSRQHERTTTSAPSMDRQVLRSRPDAAPLMVLVGKRSTRNEVDVVGSPNKKMRLRLLEANVRDNVIANAELCMIQLLMVVMDIGWQDVDESQRIKEGLEKMRQDPFIQTLESEPIRELLQHTVWKRQHEAMERLVIPRAAKLFALRSQPDTNDSDNDSVGGLQSQIRGIFNEIAKETWWKKGSKHKNDEPRPKRVFRDLSHLKVFVGEETIVIDAEVRRRRVSIERTRQNGFKLPSPEECEEIIWQRNTGGFKEWIKRQISAQSPGRRNRA